MSLKIAIEGKSGAGTSTIGLQLAKKLNCPFISFGMMYRALACVCKEDNVNLNDDEKILYYLFENLKVDLVFGEKAKVTFAGKIISERSDIQSEEVGKIASDLSSKNLIRTKLTEIQQGIINDNENIVIEGRALIRLFINLDQSFYLYANPEVRAKRRFEQLVKSGMEVDQQDILMKVRRRDWNDRKNNLGSDYSKSLIQVDVSDWDIEKTVFNIFNVIKSEENKKELKCLKYL